MLAQRAGARPGQVESRYGADAYAVRRDGKVRRVGPESTEGRLEGR